MNSLEKMNWGQLLMKRHRMAEVSAIANQVVNKPDHRLHHISKTLTKLSII